MKEYRTKVQKNHRTFKRKALKTGKVKNNALFDLLKPNVDLDSFDTDERKFYQDQKAVLRKMAPSDQVDEESKSQKIGILPKKSPILSCRPLYSVNLSLGLKNNALIEFLDPKTWV